MKGVELRIDLTWPNSKVDSLQPWGVRLLAWFVVSISIGAIITLFMHFTGGSSWGWRGFGGFIIIGTGAGYWGSNSRNRKGPKPPPEVTKTGRATQPSPSE